VKQYPIREAMNDITEAPGKTWFWELAAGVIDAERCVQCGTCVAVCPSNSIGVNQLTNLPELVKMCTGCSLCWDFCPRGGLRYEATWPSEEDDAAHRDLPTGLGHLEAAFAVRAKGSVGNVQDGGAVTAILTALLEDDVIDGALVSRPGAAEGRWKGSATIATTPAEVRAAAGSSYSQTMPLAALDTARFGLTDSPRVALVGTPCAVQGLNAMDQRRWSTGAHRPESVQLTVALLCTKNFDYQRLVEEALVRDRGVDLRRVSKIDITRGRFIVEYLDGAIAVDEPVADFHGAALKGCDECADFLGRGADISVGSVGSKDGWTSVLIRTARGLAAFERALDRFEIRPLDDPGAMERLDRLNERIARHALARDIDQGGNLFISFDEHVRAYAGTERTPVHLRRATEPQASSPTTIDVVHHPSGPTVIEHNSASDVGAAAH
jgi:coenzyme F420 hydrogenase subunit beta